MSKKKLTTDMIPEGYRFAAVDGNGIAWAYEQAPNVLFAAYWYAEGLGCIIGSDFDASNWKNSLVEKDEEPISITGPQGYLN